MPKKNCWFTDILNDGFEYDMAVHPNISTLK